MALLRSLGVALICLVALHLSACGQEDSGKATDTDPGAKMSALSALVQRGDILVSVNGHRVKSRAEAVRVMENAARDGKPWLVVIDRKGKLVNVEVDPSR